MTENIEDFRFNTAIARSMELSNALSDYMKEEKVNKKVLKRYSRNINYITCTLAPHFAEEEWEKLGKTGFVYNENWPKVSEKELAGGTKDIPVQLNGN